MKIIQKYLYFLICTVILGMIAFIGFPPQEVPLPYFLVSTENGNAEISIYEADNHHSYVFLPSYATLEQVSISNTASAQFTINSIALSDGMNCSNFSLDTPYSLEVNGKHISTLQFCKSSNIATMYIHTATGIMDYIHNDKEYEETASFTLYSADGTLNYSGSAGKIHGRGNSTWKNSKKPYALSLSEDADLLEMGSAKNWVLLANAIDKSNLHNKLIFDFAQKTSSVWVPECEYVDLYLNGNYNGLYLLSEKVEIGPQRLNIHTDNGDFLCNLDFETRWDSLRNPFLTQLNRTVEIAEPKTLSNEQYTQIRTLVNQFEAALMTSQNEISTDLIDVDSWIRRYLIDEIFCNIDADLASSYFYTQNGKFYAGPLWDYDSTFGSININENPCAFYAKMPSKYSGCSSPYYSALYENEVFYNRMTQIYREEFLPSLEKMIESDILQLSEFIEDAAHMNRLRWEPQNDSSEAVSSDAYAIIDYLAQRVTFLNNAWIDQVQYCTVQFDPDRWYTWKTASVEYGSLLETPFVDLENTTWIDKETGNVFDPAQPVTKDLFLLPLTSSDEINQETESHLSKSEIMVFLSIGVIIILLLVFTILDFKHHKKEKRKVNMHFASRR